MTRPFEAAVDAVQIVFPQLYFACHVEHSPRGASKAGLAPRFNRLLSHLSTERGVVMGALAKHLAVARSSVTAMVEQLEALGLARRTRGSGDARQVEVWLTDAGTRARTSSSVLDTARLEALFATRTPAELRSIRDAFITISRAISENS